MRKDLELNGVYDMASGYRVKITYKREEEGKTFFLGKAIASKGGKFPDQGFYEFDSTGMPLGAPNSQIYTRIS